MALTTGKVRNRTRAAGVCINPPPPEMASTNPAVKAARHRSTIFSMARFRFQK